jgi:hypothetical protein
VLAGLDRRLWSSSAKGGHQAAHLMLNSTLSYVHFWPKGETGYVARS